MPGITFCFVLFLAVCVKCRKTLRQQMPIPESSFPGAGFEDITEHFSLLSLVSVFYLITLINRAIQASVRES